ncbi:Ubiquitin carboxyl-terminal hydrolase [Operophtera brumata]|uniref:ubiquitinyl hydrolase 1 n=1 Tax=Operophtera brumata TaxID=104452 RepID=A0A0L7KP91_OPEBR|nr:Ubiquitin carboxyl-terminal hydrolase [Operophtera brumata]
MTPSPTLSTKSLNLKPSSPRLGRVQRSSPSDMCGMEQRAGARVHYLVAVHSSKWLHLKPSSPRLGRVQRSSPSDMCGMEQRASARVHYLVAVHRKQCRADAYFLASQRSKPALFGVPLLVGLRRGMSGRDLYGAVWTQVARLLDDSLGYEFPFTLRLVARGGAWCGLCAWARTCRGCALPTGTEPLVRDGPGELLLYTGTMTSSTLDALDLSALGGGSRHGASRSCMLAIEWDPTALHLRYQTTRERHCVEHSSEAVEAAKAIDLQSCLRAFTSPEKLEERYHCSACKENQPATKTLQLWKAPPILIIHLKRFQYVNNKWIKSQKVVNFPFQDFDPTDYLASGESGQEETELRGTETARATGVDQPAHRARQRRQPRGLPPAPTAAQPGPLRPQVQALCRRGKCHYRVLEASSLRTAPVSDDNLEDFHQHLLMHSQDPFELKYRLYAVVASSLRTAPASDDNLEDFHQHHLLHSQDPFDLKYRLYAVVVSVTIVCSRRAACAPRPSATTAWRTSTSTC